jgi:two-component system alkaline phosphatase synthesis response regulator PhoP
MDEPVLRRFDTRGGGGHVCSGKAAVKILVVEDDPLLREGLADLLAGAGHSVEAVADGEEALDRGADPAIDVLILDLMLPKLDGVAVCRRLRELRPHLPILMLTARVTEDDKVRGLLAGADDYVTKPFGTRELLARVEALGRRLGVRSELSETLEIDGCSIDLGRCTATRDGRAPVQLTAREASILRCLHRYRSRAVGRPELLEQVWGSRADLQTRTVDMTIANLRQKIERDPASPRIVVTVKGVGYAWGRP